LENDLKEKHQSRRGMLPRLSQFAVDHLLLLPLGALIVHLNDAHHWTRERIAAWVADPDVPQDESHAHH